MARRIKSDDLLHHLSGQILLCGVPENVRSLNGSEFTVKAVRFWLERLGVKWASIKPGSQWENPYHEGFYGECGMNRAIENDFIR